MKIEEFADFIAHKVVDGLKRTGVFNAARQKDPLTDVAECLPQTTSDDDNPSIPSGYVLASDGTVVKLGVKLDKKNLLPSAQDSMN